MAEISPARMTGSIAAPSIAGWHAAGIRRASSKSNLWEPAAFRLRVHAVADLADATASSSSIILCGDIAPAVPAPLRDLVDGSANGVRGPSLAPTAIGSHWACQWMHATQAPLTADCCALKSDVRRLDDSSAQATAPRRGQSSPSRLKRNSMRVFTLCESQGRLWREQDQHSRQATASNLRDAPCAEPLPAGVIEWNRSLMTQASARRSRLCPPYTARDLPRRKSRQGLRNLRVWRGHRGGSTIGARVGLSAGTAFGAASPMSVPMEAGVHAR